MPFEPDMVDAQREKAATGGIDRGPRFSVFFYVEEAGFLAVDARKETRRTIGRKGFGFRRNRPGGLGLQIPEVGFESAATECGAAVRDGLRAKRVSDPSDDFAAGVPGNPLDTVGIERD